MLANCPVWYAEEAAPQPIRGVCRAHWTAMLTIGLYAIYGLYEEGKYRAGRGSSTGQASAYTPCLWPMMKRQNGWWQGPRTSFRYPSQQLSRVGQHPGGSPSGTPGDWVAESSLMSEAPVVRWQNRLPSLFTFHSILFHFLPASPTFLITCYWKAG